MAVAKPLYAARLRRARAAWVFDLRPEMLALATIIAISLTSLLYLTQASNVAATGYDITYAEDRRAKLDRELQILKVNAARLQSLNRLETDATNKMGMVPAPLPDYLTATAPPVDVEAALAAAEREALRMPATWQDRLAALLPLHHRER
jgi:hypothetical protein